MFTIINEAGDQFSLTSREVARFLDAADNATIRATVTRRSEAGTQIAVTHGYACDGVTYTARYTLIAPYPNGLDMIFQAGGPEL